MKILVLSTFDKSSGGGQSRIAWELAEALSEKEEVSIMTPGKSYEIDKTSKGLQTIYFKEAGTYEGLSVPIFTRRGIKKVFSLLDEYNPDVVHVHDPGLLTLIVQMWALRHKKLIFLTSHTLPTRFMDFGVAEVLTSVVQKFLNIPLKPYLNSVYNNADVVVALNQCAKEDIRKFGYKGSLEVIPNGKDLKMFYYCEVTDIKKNEHILTFVGWISERKNQGYLVEVMKYLPNNYKLKLIGDTLNQDYRDKLDKIIKKHDLEDRVEFTGQIPYDNIPKLLSNTSVFLSASLMEVQSLVIMEALGSGTPIVGLSNETMEELIDNSTGRNLAKNTDPKEFAKIVEKVCSLNKRKYKRMSKNCRERVKHMDWDKIADRTIKAYEEYLNRDQKISGRHGRIERFMNLLPKRVQRILDRSSNDKGKIPPKIIIMTLIVIFISGGFLLLFTFPRKWFKKIIKRER